MRILVIEDNQQHLEHARHYVEQLTGCVVDFATTLAEAMELLQKNAYDGVISDVFFPAEAGASAETFESALTINKKLVEMGVHHVFNTAGNHHGRKFQNFFWETPVAIHTDDRTHFLTTGMMIEAYPKDSNGQAERKQWEAAFRYILLVPALLTLPDKGESMLRENTKHHECDCLVGFPCGDYGGLTNALRQINDPFVIETFQRFNA